MPIRSRKKREAFGGMMETSVHVVSQRCISDLAEESVATSTTTMDGCRSTGSSKSDPSGPRPLPRIRRNASSSVSLSWKALLLTLVVLAVDQSHNHVSGFQVRRSSGSSSSSWGKKVHQHRRRHRKQFVLSPVSRRTDMRGKSTGSMPMNRIRLFTSELDDEESNNDDRVRASEEDELLENSDDNIDVTVSSLSSSTTCNSTDAITNTTADTAASRKDSDSKELPEISQESELSLPVPPETQQNDQAILANESSADNDDSNNNIIGNNTISNNDTETSSSSNVTEDNSVKQEEEEEEEEVTMAPPICRIVTRAGSRLPTDQKTLPSPLFESPFLLDKLDAYYHAKSRHVTQELLLNHDMAKKTKKKETSISQAKKRRMIRSFNSTDGGGSITSGIDDSQDLEGKTVPFLRSSIEDSGFELMTRRDLDLCEALNAGYLLRLSILPDVSELDPDLFDEFYPERADDTDYDRLFDGRVLVYWRGYSQEVSTGRLLLPKIDYLQASLVQRSAAWIKSKIDKVELQIWRSALTQSRKMRILIRRWTIKLIQSIQIKQLAQMIQKSLTDDDAIVSSSADDDGDEDEDLLSSRGNSFTLSRYGGSKIKFVGSPNPNDALDPFIICETGYDTSPSPEPKSYMTNGTIPSDAVLKPPSYNGTMYSSIVEHDMYEEVNHNQYTCEYDAQVMTEEKKRRKNKKRFGSLPRMKLLERVSISNLVDIFTKSGRRELVKALFSKSELVEPTYEEVIVIWRPLPKQDKVVVAPPKIVSELADMFDFEGFDQPNEEALEERRGNIEIRNFEQVPMSNLPAVLPKTKLVFRPADAFLFDLISFITFSLVVSSVRFDNTRLDFLAIISVVLWVLRTVFRYSNKLARYDLLVKTFLTSKISQRNDGALRYLSYESGAQRAVRAALVHIWALNEYEKILSFQNQHRTDKILTRSHLEEHCIDEVNTLLNTDEGVQLDPTRAIQDLVDLKILKLADDGETVLRVNDIASSTSEIKDLWQDLLVEKEMQMEMSATPRDNSDGGGSVIEDIDTNDDDLEEYDRTRTENAQPLSAADIQNQLDESRIKNMKRVRYWQERGKAALGDTRDFLREKKQSIEAVKEAIRRFDTIEPTVDSQASESNNDESQSTSSSDDQSMYS